MSGPEAASSSQVALIPATEPESVVSQRYGRRDFLLRRLLAAVDLLAISLALVVAVPLWHHPAPLGEQIALGFLTLPIWLLVFKAYGLYDRDIKRVSHTTVDDLPWLFHALLVGCLLLWLFFAVIPHHKLIFGVILTFGGIAFVLVSLLRALVRRLTPVALGPETVLMIGEGEMTEALVRKMQTHREYGLRPVGIVTSADAAEPQIDLPVLGNGHDARGLIDRLDVDRIVVGHTELEWDTLIELLHHCRQRAIKISVLPRLFDAMGPSLEIDDVEGVTLLGINPPVLGRSSRGVKRVMDVLGSALLLLLLAPLHLLIAVAIKLDSRGPVFFTQERIGKGGKRFRLLKFRTMVADAELRRDELAGQSLDPNWLMLENDPRITRVGRLLRLTSLDELPQLWNVLRGEMSLVGPRPLIEAEDRQVEGWTRGRLDLTPGITGIWQVLGRTNIPFAEMVKLDYMYVTNWSLWTDIRLILRTLPAVVTRRGAN